MSWYWIAAAAVGTSLFLCIAALLTRVYLSRLVDRRIAAYHNDLVRKHIDEVENIYRQMRGWRHDYHNHIQTMKAHLAMSQTAELADYLGRLDTDLRTVDTVLKTGNVMVDAILNSKLSLARAKEIRIHAKAAVPSSLSVSEIDLIVVLGNLLDNAMEACMRIPEAERRFIRVYIGTLKQQLYISVSNAAGEELRRFGQTYKSEKGGSHGFGLLRVDRIADKYGGYVNRQNEPGVFATEIMLPL